MQIDEEICIFCVVPTLTAILSASVYDTCSLRSSLQKYPFDAPHSLPVGSHSALVLASGHGSSLASKNPHFRLNIARWSIIAHVDFVLKSMTPRRSEPAMLHRRRRYARCADLLTPSGPSPYLGPRDLARHRRCDSYSADQRSCTGGVCYND